MWRVACGKWQTANSCLPLRHRQQMTMLTATAQNVLKTYTYIHTCTSELRVCLIPVVRLLAGQV